MILHLGSLVLALLLFASLLPADAQPVGKVPRIGYVPSSNEFIRQKIVIFVGQPFVALAAKQATGDIPIVCGSCGDPTENGLATSLARPGGNVTGLASLLAELIGKRLELMKELLPGVSRLAVFVFPANPGTRATLNVLDTSGRALGLEIR